jgi:hypothetical protein
MHDILTIHRFDATTLQVLVELRALPVETGSSSPFSSPGEPSSPLHALLSSTRQVASSMIARRHSSENSRARSPRAQRRRGLVQPAF